MAKNKKPSDPMSIVPSEEDGRDTLYKHLSKEAELGREIVSVDDTAKRSRIPDNQPDDVLSQLYGVSGSPDAVGRAEFDELRDAAVIEVVGDDFSIATRRIGSTVSISHIRPDYEPMPVTVKIIANAAGGGKYLGRILTPLCTATTASTLAMPEGMVVPSANNALILNLPENGLSTHELPLNSFWVGSMLGYTRGATPIAIVEVNAGFGRLMIPADLTQTGGVAGSNTTQCTFTYTVKDKAGTTLLTTATPIWARPSKGKLVAATHGTVYLSGTTWKFYQADEIYDPGTC